MGQSRINRHGETGGLAASTHQSPSLPSSAPTGQGAAAEPTPSGPSQVAREGVRSAPRATRRVVPVAQGKVTAPKLSALADQPPLLKPAGSDLAKPMLDLPAPAAALRRPPFERGGSPGSSRRQKAQRASGTQRRAKSSRARLTTYGSGAVVHARSTSPKTRRRRSVSGPPLGLVIGGPCVLIVLGFLVLMSGGNPPPQVETQRDTTAPAVRTAPPRAAPPARSGPEPIAPAQRQEAPGAVRSNSDHEPSFAEEQERLDAVRRRERELLAAEDRWLNDLAGRTETDEEVEAKAAEPVEPGEQPAAPAEEAGANQDPEPEPGEAEPDEADPPE